jgi:dihydroneopterin aldolase
VSLFLSDENMKHTIEINEIKLYGFHGCLDEEAKIGGNYTIDISMETDFTKAALEDTLEDTIDYVQVNEIVKEEMAIRSKLIEQVGHRILLRMKKELHNLHAARVKIVKVCPPINGDVKNVAVILEERF